MTADVAVLDPPLSDPNAATGRTAARHIRGSSLLLTGRAISMAANFGTQVLIVRHFSKSDFGAFAYALSIVQLATTVVTLGLDRATTRFVAIYDERKEYGKLAGTLVMQVSTILTLGLAAIALVYGLQGWLGGGVIDDRQTLSILLVLIVLAPIQALDDMVVQLFAVFARPGAIFFRRHLLGPGLRMLVVVMLLAGDHGISFLAAGYVAASAAGVLLYGGILVRALRQRGVLRHARASRLVFPIREIARFTFPLLTSDLVYMLIGTSAVIMLGHYGTTTDVASFRAIVPVAGMCGVVMTSFSLLFTPTASRLFARNDEAGIRDLYWRTAAWMAVLTFPLFALTFSLARPVTTTLFGERYSGSATFLALLALGQYFNSALGFNGLTLKVFSRLRYLVVLNLGVAALNLALNVVLIPRYGAMGAAVSTAATLIAHNVGKQAGLRLIGVGTFERRYLRLYGVITLLALGLAGMQQFADPPLLVGLIAVAAASALLLRAGRGELNVAETFPEIMRIPVIRHLGRLLAGQDAGTSMEGVPR